MNARTNLTRIDRLATLVAASLPLATIAFAAPDAPSLDDIRVHGAKCDETLEHKGTDDLIEAPYMARICMVLDKPRIEWAAVDGADGYQIDVWGDYGDGIEFVTSFDTTNIEMRVEGGNADFYLVSVSSYGASDDFGQADFSIGLITRANPDAAAPGDEAADGETYASDADAAGPPPVVLPGSTEAAARIAELEAELDEVYDAMDDADIISDKLEEKNAQLAAEQHDANVQLRRLESQNTALKTQNRKLIRILQGFLSQARPR